MDRRDSEPVPVGTTTVGTAEPPDLLLPDGPAGTDRLPAVEAGLAEIRQLLRSYDERAAARERVIDRLHEENQALRAGERQLLLRPVLTDLQRLRNELLRQARSLSGSSADPPDEPSGSPPGHLPADRAADLLRSFADSLELTLDRCGVSPVRAVVGEAFDPRRHRATQVRPTDDPALDGTVAAALEDGYHDVPADRPTAAAEVCVLRVVGGTTYPPDPRTGGEDGR